MTTLVIGASTNTDRYSYKAIVALLAHKHHVIAFGNKKGAIKDVVIQQSLPDVNEGIDTITLYLNPTLQQQYIENIIALNPRRVIFNPGTENEFFFELLKTNNIIAIEACTLVMLSIGNY
jgi:predicted CoA-binding protein